MASYPWEPTAIPSQLFMMLPLSGSCKRSPFPLAATAAGWPMGRATVYPRRDPTSHGPGAQAGLAGSA